MLKQTVTVLMLAGVLFGTSYENWQKEQIEGFNDYKASLDKEFSDMLKKDWQAFKAYKSKTPYSKPKPKKMPIAKTKPPKKQKSPKVLPPKISPPDPVPAPPPPPPSTPNEPKKPNKEELVFYGTKVQFSTIDKLDVKLSGVDKKGISDFWQNVSKIDQSANIKELKYYKKALQLNFWGTFLLASALSETRFKTQNEQNLYTWFLFTRLGIDSKVSYDKKRVYLMVYSPKLIYGTNFIKIDKKPYYIINKYNKKQRISAIHTYKGDYSKSAHPIDLSIKKPIHLSQKTKKIKVAFKYQGKKYAAIIPYNQNVIDFYQNFPQSAYEIYFDAQMSNQTKAFVLKFLSQSIRGKSEYEAVNMILRFVQTGFAYKTDDDQFGHEKTFFPEELFGYPYSDCEDRSVLFSYLVKKLLGLDVVGVLYSGHMATAVRFSTPIKGDSFRVNGKRYTVCDPTYINANIGMAMPQYKRAKFKVVK